MATVFLARLEGVAGFQRLYAIKRLHPHLANEKEFVDMFLDEARLAARIHHPNVVSVLEVGTSERGYYLVMEYIEGDTAARLLGRSTQAGGRVPPAAAVRIAFDTLLGLHAAHDLADDEGQPLHIVHRDVSPQNILVGVDGVSRITDFGVAHAATRLSSTRTGQLKGKLAYMAPEQAKGAIVDRRADVFAMGVVLWELLAGKRLFKASNDAERLHRILFAPMPTLRGAGIDIPIPLEAVCMRALDREPETRYATAADFADELERVGRSLGMLSTTREIASYVDGTVGAEISQQREVVRGWLSRSEPSRNDRLVVPQRAPTPPSLPGAPPSLRRPSSRDVTVAATPSAQASVPPPMPTNRAVTSSVSSAVLELPEATTTDARAVVAAGLTESPSPSRQLRTRVLWSIVGASLLLAAVGVGFVIPRSSGPTPAAQAALAAPVLASPATAVATAVARVDSLPPLETANPLPAASGRADGSTQVSSARAHGPTPANAAPRPGHGARGASSDDLDDLSKNPYR